MHTIWADHLDARGQPERAAEVRRRYSDSSVTAR
jgi:hypothetical protein